MPTILDVNFGREFFGWPETLEKNKAEKFAIKIRHHISLRNLPAILLKFAGPKKKNHPKSALHNVGTNTWSEVIFLNRQMWPKAAYPWRRLDYNCTSKSLQKIGVSAILAK